MAKDSNRRSGLAETETAGRLLSRFLADENGFDRRGLWRLGSWGFAAVGAVALAMIANQSSLGWRRQQLAASDLAHEAQQIQSLARDEQNETRRLASAVDTLNSDRDRLFSRVTVLEQGLDSVTGAIVRPSSTPAAPTQAASQAASQAATIALVPVPAETQAPPAPTAIPNPAPPPVPLATTVPIPPEKPRAEPVKPEQAASTAATAATATTPTATSAASSLPQAPATSLVASTSLIGPPDPAASKLMEPPKVAAPPAAPIMAATAQMIAAAKSAAPTPMPEAVSPSTVKEADASAAIPPDATVQQTDFAVDLGSANSVNGLRALWRGLLQANADLVALHPIIMVKESSTGFGMQLRLAAGPLKDAAAAAKICAALTESQRSCETTIFDGQRLAMKDEPTTKASGAKSYRHWAPHQTKKDDPLPPKADPSSSTTNFSWFKRTDK